MGIESRGKPEGGETPRLLTKAGKSVEAAMHSESRDALSVALVDVIRAVESLLSNYFVARTDREVSDRVYGPPAEDAVHLIENGMQVFNSDLRSFLEKVGYRTPPPPSREVLVSNAVRAVKHIRAVPQRRYDAEEALELLRDRLVELRDRRDEGKWGEAKQLVTQVRPCLLVIGGILGGALGDATKEQLSSLFGQLFRNPSIGFLEELQRGRGGPGFGPSLA